jgi:hypothetical protein
MLEGISEGFTHNARCVSEAVRRADRTLSQKVNA